MPNTMPYRLVHPHQMSVRNRNVGPRFEDGPTFEFVSRIDISERLGRIHHGQVVDGSSVYKFRSLDSWKHCTTLWKQGPGPWTWTPETWTWTLDTRCGAAPIAGLIINKYGKNMDFQTSRFCPTGRPHSLSIQVDTTSTIIFRQGLPEK